MDRDRALPSPAIRLRPARDTDAPAVAACVDSAYQKWVARIGRKPWPMLQDYVEIVARGTVVVAVTADDEVAGILVLDETAEGFLVENVAVSPPFAGQGIGRSLLRHAESRAIDRGYDSVCLYTNEKMAENIVLYRKVGYVEYDRRREEGFVRVFMRKPLR